MDPIATRSFYCSLVIFSFLSLAFSFANANCDPGPQQDFCVSVDDSFKGVFVNGKFCKNPENVTVDNFKFSGLDRPGNTDTSLGKVINVRTETDVPGLNSLDLTIVRIDLEPNGGLNAPHLHPRGAEILHVTQGKMLAGFVTGRGNNYRLFTKVLKTGQGMVIPYALPHFQMNVGKMPAVAFAVRNSPNSGYVELSSSVFRTNPLINTSIVAESFKISEKWARMIQKSLQAEEI